VVEEAKGTVLLVQNGNPQPVTLEEEETVEQGDEIITKENSQATLSLDENTLIRLGPDSDLHITALGPNETNGFISRLELAGGKIMSEVEHLADRQSTFEVNAGGVVCGVRGTAFEVEKQGQEVRTNTFRGVVEMKKDHYIQKVKANEHLSFSFRKHSFLGKRKINQQEMGNYHSWNVKLGGYQQKARERKGFMNSLKQLPFEDRSNILKQMKQAPPRQRLQTLRRALQPAGAHPSAQPARKFSPREKPVQRQGLQPKPVHRPMNQGTNKIGGNKNHPTENKNGRPPKLKNNGVPRTNQARPNPVIRRPRPSSPKGSKQRGPKREFRVPKPQAGQAPAHPRPSQKPNVKRKNPDAGINPSQQK
jgi:predicted secreted protein